MFFHIFHHASFLFRFFVLPFLLRVARSWAWSAAQKPFPWCAVLLTSTVFVELQCSYCIQVQLEASAWIQLVDTKAEWFPHVSTIIWSSQCGRREAESFSFKKHEAPMSHWWVTASEPSCNCRTASSTLSTWSVQRAKAPTTAAKAAAPTPPEES